MDTGDQERFDECESVMNDVLRNIRSVGYQWQVRISAPTNYHGTHHVRFISCRASSRLSAVPEQKKVLTRAKYLRAVGQVVDIALSKVIEDVLALPDIPELDSRRLSELCRILNALEGLFADDLDMVSNIPYFA